MINIKKSDARTARVISLIMALTVFFFCSSCGESKSDDSSMTEELLNSYMKGLCNYNIGAMNKCCMAKRDVYDDGEAALKACKSLSSQIEWKSDNISIDGNSAIAQVSITMPVDIDSICGDALNDTVSILEGNPDDNPSDLLVSAIKKRAGRAETTVISAEIAMTKVENKWYIVKSLGVNRIVSDIRTPVVRVFSYVEK